VSPLYRIVAASCVAISLAACSFQNRYEREAEKITRSVMANDLRPVQDDIAPSIKITRVKIAEWSDELGAQGKLLSVKEHTPCDPGWHCFDVKFEKRTYAERLQLDDTGKIVSWSFHMATSTT